MYFVGNLLHFSAVREFWKSVKNLQSYRHQFGVLLFWRKQCTCVTCVMWCWKHGFNLSGQLTSMARH